MMQHRHNYKVMYGTLRLMTRNVLLLADLSQILCRGDLHAAKIFLGFSAYAGGFFN